MGFPLAVDAFLMENDGKTIRSSSGQATDDHGGCDGTSVAGRVEAALRRRPHGVVSLVWGASRWSSDEVEIGALRRRCHRRRRIRLGGRIRAGDRVLERNVHETPMLLIRRGSRAL